jgi:uncharacterized protein YbaR (Trm112 family)
MKKNMLDILACPLDKNYPLELIELNVKELEKEDKVKENSHPLNNDENNPIVKKNNNGGGGNKINEIKQNEKVIIVIDGILYCQKCSRFYPIIDEIPIMLPDELREKRKRSPIFNKMET